MLCFAVNALHRRYAIPFCITYIPILATQTPVARVLTYCSVTATDVSVEMECLLRYMSAIDTLPRMNTFICLAAVWYRKAQSPNASHSSAWHYSAFLLPHEWCSTLGISVSKGCQYNDVCAWNACALLCIYSHLMLTFTSLYHVLANIYTHAAWPHFWPKKNICHDLSSDPRIFTYYGITNIIGNLITISYLWPF
jgi:hypothetical protein